MGVIQPFVFHLHNNWRTTSILEIIIRWCMYIVDTCDIGLPTHMTYLVYIDLYYIYRQTWDGRSTKFTNDLWQVCVISTTNSHAHTSKPYSSSSVQWHQRVTQLVQLIIARKTYCVCVFKVKSRLPCTNTVPITDLSHCTGLNERRILPTCPHISKYHITYLPHATGHSCPIYY